MDPESAVVMGFPASLAGLTILRQVERWDKKGPADDDTRQDHPEVHARLEDALFRCWRDVCTGQRLSRSRLDPGTKRIGSGQAEYQCRERCRVAGKFQHQVDRDTCSFDSPSTRYVHESPILEINFSTITLHAAPPIPPPHEVIPVAKPRFLIKN